MTGTTVSHYRILEKLGEGGMGVVYKAEDIKLNRAVAIKFLPKRLSVHGEERERFTLEAQSASALNHPNICTIHEIDEIDDEAFIVMEFVEGATLREWTRRKAEQSEGYRKLGIKESVDLAIQVAEGLEKAHEKGIIHRDVKAENVMVTGDGRAKIMDFGLAKLRGVSKLTKTGSTVGTIAYMSPEQVEGLETDHRTDIFSFGVVLYEMLAGQLPFRAEHEAALMYEIINVEPPSLLDVRKGVDGEIERVVMKCLEKNRNERYQSMREVAVDLKRYKRDSEGKRMTRRVSPVAPPPENPVRSREDEPRPGAPGKSRAKILLAGGALGLLLVAGLFFVLRPSPQSETTPTDARITKVTSRPGLEDEPTWSPDGKFLAYTTDDRGNYDIVVQPMPSGQPIRVVDNGADDMEPAWSPDGSKLAFVSARDHGGRLSLMMSAGAIEPYVKGKGGDIFLVSALGGAPVKLTENGFDPAWSPDGKTIVFRSIRGSQWDLWTIAAEGGKPAQLTNDRETDYQPSWSPDGQWIVYGCGESAGFEVKVLPARGGTLIPLTADKSLVTKPTWSSDGRSILFSSYRSGSLNIWKIPFAASGILNGEVRIPAPTRVTIGEGDDVSICAAAVGGKIAYATVRNTGDIWELTVASTKLRQISSETSSEDNPQLSPDGKTLVVQSDRTGMIHVWTMDLEGNFLSQLSSNKDGAIDPRWAPDGKRVGYLDIGSNKIFVRSLGDIMATEVVDRAGDFSWSPDGKRLVVDRESDGKYDVWIYSFETGEVIQLTHLPSDNVLASWSPDGKWVAFNNQTRNERQVWIVPSSGGTPRQITSGESEYSHPQWSPRDKDLILCLRDHKNLCLISAGTGKIKQLTSFMESNIGIDYPTWSIDGQKIYFSLWKKVGDVYTLENY